MSTDTVEISPEAREALARIQIARDMQDAGNVPLAQPEPFACGLFLGLSLPLFLLVAAALISFLLYL